MAITVKVEISNKQIQAVIDTHKEITGKVPSNRWLRAFFKYDVYHTYDTYFEPELGDTVSLYLKQK